MKPDPKRKIIALKVLLAYYKASNKFLSKLVFREWWKLAIIVLGILVALEIIIK